MKKISGLRIASDISSVVLGLTFVLSGLIKVNDPHGTQYKIEDYFAALSLPSGNIWALALSVMLAVVELTLGASLLLRACKRVSAWAALMFMVVMTPLTLWLAIENPISDCGCFGDVVKLTNWQTFWKNIVLLAAAVVCFLTYRKASDGRRWLPALVAVVGLVLTMVSLKRLPFVDFLPYKMGTDVHAVDNFFADSDGEDMTMMLLDADDAVVMISPYLQTADEDGLERCSEMLKQAQREGKTVCCLTASGSDDIERCRQRLSADYPFWFADDVELKTMVRANPGIVVMKKGVIVDKLK